MALIGRIVAMTGVASLISGNGEKRNLQLGDSIQTSDTIQTPRGVEVDLELANGRIIHIAAEQLVAFTEELASVFVPDALDNAINLATIDTVIKAIEEGRDINEVLEETAAGIAGQTNAYGFGFVDLLRVNTELSNSGFSFDTNAADRPDSIPAAVIDDTLVANSVTATSSTPVATPPMNGVPSVVVDIVDAALNVADSVSQVTFTFSEAPVGFDATDISATGGVISGLAATANPLVYTATAGYEGAGSVSVAAGSYTNAAGNAGTAGSDTVSIDTAPPVPTITLTPNVTADDIINATEAAGNVAITGTVGGDAKVNDTVTLVVNGNTYTGLVQPGLTFSILVAGSDLVADGNKTIDAAVSTTDAAGNTASASASEGYTVEITAPNISAQSFTYAENQVAGAVVATVVATDNVAVTGYKFTATGTNLSADGYYQINSSGVITITAAGVASSANNFEIAPNGNTYSVTAVDAVGNSSAANITLNESNVNEAVVAASDTYTMNEDGGAITLTPLTGDIDLDGTTPTIQSINGTTLTPGVAQVITVTGGVVNVDAAGVITFTPNANFNGTVTFPYVITDGVNTSTANQVITVNAVNDAPVLNLDANNITDINVIGGNSGGGHTFTGGDGGSSNTLSFNIGAGQLPNTVSATVTLATVDNSFTLQVNGGAIHSSTAFELQSGALAAGETYLKFADGGFVTSPWVANDNGLPRVQAIITETGVHFYASRTTTSTVLEELFPDSGSFILPSFALGVNDITVVNPDNVGVDGIAGNINVTVQGAGYTNTFFENGTPVAIADTDIAITDVDNANMQSAIITLTNAQAGDVLSVGTLPPGITANVAGNVVTLTGSASLADYQTAIHAITYSSTSENPNTTPRTITVVVNDGIADSNTATLTINVVAINDAPVGVADNFAGASSVVEGATVVRGNVLTNDTDVDSSTLMVAQFATDSSAAVISVNGTNSITTALGGTVVMNADGTFTYTAPVRNHADAVSDVDSFVYRSSDGSLNSAWTTVNINITDTAPVANNDVDSVGIGATITGNIITGAGGNQPGGADTAVDNPMTVSSVTFGATTYTVPVGGRTIITSNGTLTIQQDGSYTYSSNYQSKSLASGGTATKTEWTNAGFGVFGFDTTGNQPSDLYSSGNTNSINTANLNATSAGRVMARNNGANDTGIGVESNATTGNSARIEKNENLVIDVGFVTNSAKVTLTALASGETAIWRAYDSTGAIVGNGSIAGNGAINTSTITAPNSYRYLVFTSSGSNYLVDGLTAVPDLSGITPDQFNYIVADGDGTLSNTATLTVTTDSAVSAVTDAATLYEAGLASGTQAGMLATSTTGNLLANDAGITPTTTITSINGIAPAGGTITVTDAIGTLMVNATTGAYTYTLNGPTTQGVTDTPTFNYVLTDSVTGQTANANLVINVVDDVPTGSDITHTLQAAATLPTYNLVLVIDRSGSMTTIVSGTQTRMDIAKAALAAMIDKYDGLGNVNVQIVDFSSTVNESAWYVDDTAGAKAYINGLVASGSTYYKDALNSVMTGYTPPVADKSLVYFLSDGAPTTGQEVVATQQTAWESFLTNNNIDISFAIGVGSGAVLAPMLPISYPNSVNGVNEPYAQVVTNDTELANTLLQTVDQGVVVGNVSVLSGGGSSGFMMGADGGQIQSIVVDGVTHNYVVGTPIITIDTAKGGQLTLNFLTGEYNYQLKVNTTIQGQQETFAVTAVDADGDTKTVNMIINLDYVANLDANRDIVLTNIADGSPIAISTDALMHNDITRGSGVVTGVSAAAGGAAALSGNAVTFSPVNAQVSSVAETPVGDSNNALAANNNSIANAIDLSDRSRWGRVSDADAGNVANPNAISIRMSGSTTAALLTTDNDYVKVYLRAGEKLVMDIDNGVGGAAAVSTDTSLAIYNAAGTSLATNASSANLAQGGAGSTSTADPYLEYTATADGYYYVRVYNAATGDVGTYDLWLSIDNPVYTPTSFDYTLTDSGVSDTSQVDVYRSLGTTITGGSADEILLGNSTNDTLIGNAGNDALLGNDGDDTLQGGVGNDRLEGGAGSDTLDGGADNDLLIGGAGNDTLTGGTGADVFKWSLADAGPAGTPASDVITDFDTAAGSDKLDLRDLLQGEIGQGVGANLENYLHFEKVGANTVVHISSNGGFENGYTPTAEVQTITLQNVDLVLTHTTDQQIIQDLINNQKLITD